MIKKISKIKNILRMQILKKRGVRISDDCRITGRVSFGSEPYLVSIGKHVTIADRVQFITHDGGNWVLRNENKYSKVNNYGTIEIKDNCFIGYGAIILPRVKIGPNAVVGAGSVVTKDVPGNSIVAGNPARIITDIESYYKKNKEKTIITPEGNFEWREVLEYHFGVNN